MIDPTTSENISGPECVHIGPITYQDTYYKVSLTQLDRLARLFAEMANPVVPYVDNYETMARYTIEQLRQQAAKGVAEVHAIINQPEEPANP